MYMSKEGGNLLKFAVMAIIFLVMLAFAIQRIRNLERQIERLENAPADTIRIVRIDTVKVDTPVPVHHYIKEKDTTFIVLTDVKVDTVKELVFLPREYMVYKDTSYRAVVSGVQPRLDSIEIYQHNTVQTITKTVKVPDKKRWGLGVNVSAGWDGKEIKPFVGIGVQYNIIRW